MKHCCVIGGSGFIGSHVVRRLCKSRDKITVIGRSAVPVRPLPGGVKYISCDYSNIDDLKNSLKDVDELINLAYSTVPKTSYDDPICDLLSNLPPAVNLFEFARSLDLKKFVYVSSGGTVYGKVDRVPITEGHPVNNPISPYGITKLTIEKYGLLYHYLHDLPVVIVRPGNAYGEGQLPFLPQGFVATVIPAIIENKPIYVFGENGTVRDYVYVTDVADGIISAMEEGIPGVCYNLGTGLGRSNKQVLDIICRQSKLRDSEHNVVFLPPRPFDVPVNVLDSSKLSDDTGWLARVGFEQGIRRTWDWFLRYYSEKQHQDI